MTKRVVYDPTVAGIECAAARRAKAASEITVLRPNATGQLVEVGVIPPPGEWPSHGLPTMRSVPQAANAKRKATNTAFTPKAQELEAEYQAKKARKV